MKLIGRKKYLRKLSNYTAMEPENKAYFGVKGLGKSAIIESVFSKAKCIEIAEENHYLYVRTILNPGKKGEDLVNYLLDKVINAIDLIGDSSLKDNLLQKIKDDTEKFHSKDSVLNEILQEIRDYDYYVILVMDEFHNMGRNSAVGSEQYDFLRSLNESGLMYYWIISDSDFSDVYATEHFTTSFFAQKFLPETMPQMLHEDMIEMIEDYAEKYEVDLSGNADTIYGIIGGIPGFVAPAIKCYESLQGTDFDIDEYIEAILEYPKSQSLLTVWSRSLTEEQKKILVELSWREKVYQKEYQDRGIIGKINQLGDNSGLGLVIHSSDDEGIYWTLNSKLYKEFIIRRRAQFDAADIKSNEKEEKIQQVTQTTYVQNNYYVNNNFFNPDGALEALVNLKQLVSNHPTAMLPDSQIVESAVQQLPFQQEGWESLDDEQKEEKVDAYAEKIFGSNDFKTDSLSENQMQRFYLTQSILDNLSEGCRNNLISAIQVYDLLQFCVDKFGLNLFNSESARGILFAKVYELILKENLKPALASVEEAASTEIRVGKNVYMVKDAPESELTINSFTYAIKPWNVQNRLGALCAFELGIEGCDKQWWSDHRREIEKIGYLRNDCCHSGDNFTAEKLGELIKRLFEDGAIGKVIIYNDIANRIV